MKESNNREQLVLEAIHRHSTNPDWYSAQLIAAIPHTTSLEEAISLADAMFEDTPEPPVTTDAGEAAAREELSNELAKILPQKQTQQPPLQQSEEPVDAAMAATDRRGVEHRGKGDPRGGQFVQKGMGGADKNAYTAKQQKHPIAKTQEQQGGTGLEQKTGPPSPVMDVPSGGLPEDFDLNVPEDVVELADDSQAEEFAADQARHDAFLAKQEALAKAAEADRLASSTPEGRELVRQKMMTAPIVSDFDMSSGINKSILVTLEDGSTGVWKPSSGEGKGPTNRGATHPAVRGRGIKNGTQYKREIATHRLAEMFGIGHLVPETVLRNHSTAQLDGPGSLQRFVKSAITADKARLEDMNNISLNDRVKALIFDYVIDNTDRHSGNWMVPLTLIDNGLAFPNKKDTGGLLHYVKAGGDHYANPATLSAEIPDEVRVWASKHEEVSRALDMDGIEEDAKTYVMDRLARLADRKYRTVESLLEDTEEIDPNETVDMEDAVELVDDDIIEVVDDPDYNPDLDFELERPDLED